MGGTQNSLKESLPPSSCRLAIAGGGEARGRAGPCWLLSVPCVASFTAHGMRLLKVVVRPTMHSSSALLFYCCCCPTCPVPSQRSIPRVASKAETVEQVFLYIFIARCVGFAHGDSHLLRFQTVAALALAVSCATRFSSQHWSLHGGCAIAPRLTVVLVNARF